MRRNDRRNINDVLDEEDVSKSYMASNSIASFVDFKENTRSINMGNIKDFAEDRVDIVKGFADQTVHKIGDVTKGTVNKLGDVTLLIGDATKGTVSTVTDKIGDVTNEVRIGLTKSFTLSKFRRR